MTENGGSQRPEGRSAPDPELTDGEEGNSLDALIAKYFTGGGSDPGASVFEVLAEHSDALPHLRLRSTGGDHGPPLSPLGPDFAQSPAPSRRYQVIGEIAHGGMGVVHHARDLELGRDLAIKMLRKRHLDKPGMVQRFIEEAQICGQLQHPGIVPLYELGLMADRQPYFTMKLIAGRTLASMLEERRSPEVERPRFLAIFEQVCQTVAYAHARGVIHRDLKPRNVMVGSFGEVQVVDWGLAKVLLREDGSSGEGSRDGGSEMPDIETVRSRSNAAHSSAGSVLGTPAYMSPEQARGQIDELDTRSDVFGLGAILCEILSGAPPYPDPDANRARRRAAEGCIDDAMSRLRACGAEPALVEIAEACLQPDPDRRPRTGGVLAGRIAEFLATVDDRLRRAELLRAAAEARATVERRARRTTLALSSLVVVLLLLGGGSYLVLRQERFDRVTRATRAVEECLAEARRLWDEAKVAPVGKPEPWDAALATARRAVSLAVDDVEADTRRRVGDLASRIARDRADASRDARTVEMLELVRSAAVAGDHPVSEYQQVFRDRGIDVVGLSAADIAGKLRSERIEPELRAAIDNWINLRETGSVIRKKLIAVQRLASPDPWRKSLYDAVERHDTDSVRKLVAAADLLDRPVETISILAGYLRFAAKDPSGANALLRRVLERHPADFWIHFHLGVSLADTSRAEATGYMMAARALRPDAAPPWFGLGIVHGFAGDLGAAKAAYEKAIGINPKYFRAINNLGHVRLRLGEPEAALELFERAIGIAPGYALAHNNAGVALSRLGRSRRAAEEFEKAVELEPRNPDFRAALGSVRMGMREYRRAVEAYREADRLRPQSAEILASLGHCLHRIGEVAEAGEVLERATRLDPKSGNAHYNLGLLQKAQSLVAEALASFRRSLELGSDPDHEAHCQIGVCEFDLGRFPEAEASFRLALRGDPESGMYRFNLGNALASQGKVDAAIASYRSASEAGFAPAYERIAAMLFGRGDHAGALEAAGKAVELAPRDFRLLNTRGFLLLVHRRFAEAEQVLRRAVSIEDGHGLSHYNLARCLLGTGRIRDARSSFRAALQRAGPDSELHLRAAKEVQRCEAFLELEPRLDRVLAGADSPRGAEETCRFAELCYEIQRHASAARLFRSAFGQVVESGDRCLDAVRAAVLAASGAGAEAARLDRTSRTECRAQALAWLRGELDRHRARVRSEGAAGGSQTASALADWQRDVDLAPVREPGQLAGLPPGERVSWERFWREVEQLAQEAAQRK